jgi:hypothetical protein
LILSAIGFSIAFALLLKITALICS